MNKLKNILLGASLLAMPVMGFAQNGSNTSYSRFGLGTLSDQSQTFNRGMGGVAYGLRYGSKINMLNPASYSCIDSLSFIFDVGMSMHTGQLTQGNTTKTVQNTSFSNVNAGFHVARNLGMSFGFVPYSSIGYNFYNEGTVGDTYTSTQPITSKTSYTGSGGLHQAYLGIGWKPIGNLSIGVNGSYLWGDYLHSITQTFYQGTTSSSDYTTQNQSYSASLKTYKLDFGLQLPVRFSNADWVTLGATYSLGHKISGDVEKERHTNASDSIVQDAFDLPHTFGVGLAWRHKDKLVVAADATLEKWADCKSAILPQSQDGLFESKTGAYLDRKRFAVGMEYIPKGTGKANTYWEIINYRAGFNYSTPYVKINGQDGPYEIGASIGVGLPLQTKRMSTRSVINISAEWKQRCPSVSNMIKENYFMLNIGVTFNEGWFSQWKIN